MPSHSSDHLSLVIVNRILFLSACECQAFRDSVKGTKILRYAFLGTGIHYIVQQLCCKLTCAQCQLKKLRSTRGSMQVLPVHTCKLSPAACVQKKKNAPAPGYLSLNVQRALQIITNKLSACKQRCNK